MKIVESDRSTWAPFMEYLGFPYADAACICIARVDGENRILITSVVSFDTDTLTVIRTPYPDFVEKMETYSELYVYIYARDMPHELLGVVHLTPGKVTKVDSPITLA